jgi:cobalt-zinc-cadmium resistance protein CzcA
MGALALPIDAVPDITNNRCRSMSAPPALARVVEKQVAFPIETALAGIPGLEYTRSLSRNGFAQVTAVFSDKSDIYFARQQVGERLTGVKENLPSGVNPEMGPIATGLGEVYMWTIRLDHRGDDKHVPGEPGIQPDGSYITPEGDRLTSEADKATYLRTAQDWIVAPLLKNTPGLAGVDSIGGYAKQFLVVPDVQKLASMGLTLSDLANALEKNNTSVGGGFVERNGEGLAVRLTRAGAQCGGIGPRGRVLAQWRADHARSGCQRPQRAGDPHGLGLGERERSGGGHRHHADRREQPHRRDRRG